MVDELEPIAGIRLIDRIRLGEQYLTYNLYDRVNKELFSSMKEVKASLEREKRADALRKNKENQEEEGLPYGDLAILKEEAHDLDKRI